MEARLQLPLDGRRRGVGDHPLVRSLHGELVDHEHPALVVEAGGDQRPERAEPLRRDMGEPGREEHDVVGGRRRPGEQVGPQVADVGGADAVAVEREHLGRSVDRSKPCGVPGELDRPLAGAARELEHLSARPKDLERRGELTARVGVVRERARPVVLARARPVVSDLLGQQGVEVIAPHDPSRYSRGILTAGAPDERAIAELGALVRSTACSPTATLNSRYD